MQDGNSDEFTADFAGLYITSFEILAIGNCWLMSGYRDIDIRGHSLMIFN